MKMNPLRPYLVKALMAWIEDNGMTPYLVANAEVPGVQVPPGIVHEGRVLFNISSNAISNFMIDDETLSFSARFSNRDFAVVLPLNSLEVVFSKENGIGMGLSADPSDAAQERARELSGSDDDTPPPKPSADRRAHLRVVK